jgi:hypothetical protein
MAEYDRDLVATIADAVSAYVRDARPDDVAVEVLIDLEAEGWEISHPNDADGGSYTSTAATHGTDAPPLRPPANPWDFFRGWKRDSN